MQHFLVLTSALLVLSLGSFCPPGHAQQRPTSAWSARLHSTPLVSATDSLLHSPLRLRSAPSVFASTSASSPPDLPRSALAAVVGSGLGFYAGWRAGEHLEGDWPLYSASLAGTLGSTGALTWMGWDPCLSLAGAGVGLAPAVLVVLLRELAGAQARAQALSFGMVQGLGAAAVTERLTEHSERDRCRR